MPDIDTALNAVVATSRVYNTDRSDSRILTDLSFLLQGGLGLLGLIFFFLIFYEGYKIMIARDDSSKIEEARERIKNLVIGLIVISLAYAIVAFAIGVLFVRTTPAYTGY